MRNRRPAGVYKNIHFTVIRLDGERATRCLRTPPGTLFNAASTEALLKQEADRVEKWFPGSEFRLVPLRDGNFNFVEVKINILEVKPEMQLAV